MIAKLAINNVKKSYGGQIVLNIEQLAIREHEFFVLLGHSGSGKSTLLDCISGFTIPEEGDILLDGQSLSGVPTRARGLGYVFQSGGVYPHMTVFDNIAFPLRNRKVSKSELKKKVEKLADFLHITSLLQRRPHQLSGGEQQRVAIAKVLAPEPQLLLFDEPLSGLDVSLRGELREEILKLHREIGATSIWVTHDQNEAAMISDRLAILENGKILQTGNFEELTLQPANLSIARFIGNPSINLIDNAHLFSDDNASEGLALQFDSQQNNKLHHFLSNGGCLAFYPDAIQTGSETGSGVRIKGRIMDTRLMAGRLIGRLQVNQKTYFFSGSRDLARAGKSLTAFIPEDRIFLFSSSGERITLEQVKA